MEQTQTIKTEDGEIYVQGDKIIGRMATKGGLTTYYKGNLVHRDGDLPACIDRNVAGEVVYEAHYRDGMFHRDGDQPARIWSGDYSAVEYWQNGLTHRDGNKPAFIKRNPDGVIIVEAYYRMNMRHRDNDLPARIERNKNGEIICEAYYRDGVRIEPAQIKASAGEQELAAAHAKNIALQARVDQLEQKINAIKLLLE